MRPLLGAEAERALQRARDGTPQAIRLDDEEGHRLHRRAGAGACAERPSPRRPPSALARAGRLAELAARRAAGEAVRPQHERGAARDIAGAEPQHRRSGEILHLTLETARNYSKRLYAKTGTRGQADLVRLVLTNVAMLA